MRTRHGRPALGLLKLFVLVLLIGEHHSHLLASRQLRFTETLVCSGQLFEMVGLDSCHFQTWSVSCSGIVRHTTGTNSLPRKQARNWWFANDCGRQDGPGDPTKWPFSFPMCRISGLYKTREEDTVTSQLCVYQLAVSLRAGLGIYGDVEASDRPQVPFIRCIHPFNLLN